jgi:hypothetical protein
MRQRAPLTDSEKAALCRGKLAGKSTEAIAAELQCSPDCVKKWWKRFRRNGPLGLQARPYGSPKKGALAHFAPSVAQMALTLKQRYPRWGPNRVLVELHAQPQFREFKLPSASRLAAFFTERCPECVVRHKPRSLKRSAPPPSPGAHIIWGLDTQEGIRLQDGGIATICNIRDPVGAAMIASQAFSVRTRKHWRKLGWTEVRQVIRAGATEWQTLPEALLTDNELSWGGSPTDPFPGSLTLWLRGLGVQHLRIRPHRPTDQPHIERNHRTLDGLAMNGADLANLEALQQALDRERRVYNTAFPVRASDCAGAPPLTVHPELRCPPRPYDPNVELALFDLQRVYQHLATLSFERKVNSVGQVYLGGQVYSIGMRWARCVVAVQLDPTQPEWVFYVAGAVPEQPLQEIARRAPKGLDVKTLTGLEPQEQVPAGPIQLSFPCFVPGPRGTTS